MVLDTGLSPLDLLPGAPLAVLEEIADHSIELWMADREEDRRRERQEEAQARFRERYG